MPRKTTVTVFTVDWEKLKNIKTKHGFPNYAETVGYVLQKFPEMIQKEEHIEQKPAPKPTGAPGFVQLGELK